MKTETPTPRHRKLHRRLNRGTSVATDSARDTLSGTPAQPAATEQQKKRRGRPRKTASAAQLEANGGDSQASTRPGTNRGKRNKRRNTKKNSLWFDPNFLEGEERAQVHREVSGGREPASELESLILEIVDCLLRLQRALLCKQGAVLTKLAKPTGE